MKKNLLFILFCCIGSIGAQAQTFHQDSVYFFLRLKNPKATFTINKPGMKHGWNEYSWDFYLNADNNRCTGNNNYKGNNGDEYWITVMRMYDAFADTTGPITVSLLNKMYFSASVNKYDSSFNGYSSIWQAPCNFHVTGDSGIFITMFKDTIVYPRLDLNDDYFTKTYFRQDTATASEYDYGPMVMIPNTATDANGDHSLGVMDVLGSSIHNVTQDNGVPLNGTLDINYRYDSLGTFITLQKGGLQLFPYQTDGTYPQGGFVNFSGGHSNSAITPGRYKLLVKPDSLMYGINIVPTYYGGGTYWNTAVDLNVCSWSDTTSINYITLKRVNIGLSGPNSIQGYLLNGNGPRKPGEPVRGAGIVIEQIPGGGQAYRTTDTTGFYNIDNLPSGDFKVTVNLPGNSMKAVFNTTLDASGNDIDTAVFFTANNLIYNEDTKLTIDSAYADFVAERNHNRGLQLYPNPNNGKMHLVYPAESNLNTEISILDLRGRILYRKEILSTAEGENKLELDLQNENINAGIYFIEIRQAGQIQHNTFIIKQP